MSIKKFKHIKNLAVFQNFDWDAIIRDDKGAIVEFSPINIFYGRNYSGKTTLSRIVRALELGEISDKYEDPEFTVCIKDLSDVTQTNLSAHTKKVRVFNEDFVKENLRFISNADENIVPFAILGGNAALEEEIENLSIELGLEHDETPTGFYLERKNAREIYRIAKTTHETVSRQLDSKLTQKATSRETGIKYKPERFGDQNYNKAKLEADIDLTLADGFEPITDEEQQALLRLLNEKPNPNIIAISRPNFSLSELSAEAELLVTKSLTASGKIEELVRNSMLNKWVKDGKTLHEHKPEDCAFCGNKITEERWSALESHFDEESEKLSSGIASLLAKVEAEVILFSDFLSFDNNAFFSRFHPDLNRLRVAREHILGQYKESLEQLRVQLVSRADDIINVGTFATPFNVSARLVKTFDFYETIRSQSNAYTGKLGSDQASAKTSLRLKEVHGFVTTIQYEEEVKNIVFLQKELNGKEEAGKMVANKIKDQISLIESRQRLMNDEEKGALKVNEYLNNYFGHDFLTLKAIEEADSITNGKKIRFEIVRNGNKAHHLSEGECSLIAFCYFMAKLEDVETKGQKPIIWIDDPISSLDGNHIFFIYSLINSEIVTSQEFEQLFISTHNLDFLKYLKRLPGALNKNQSRYFMTVREGDKSKIKLMPKYLKDYVTEFNYLFHQIYICANADTDDDDQHVVYYNFANNARKFLESFLFYKYPNAAEHDDKLYRFFGDNRQASSMTERINNEYSHLEGIFERSMIPVDVPEMKKVATFVLDRIKEKDLDQFESLLKSIGIELLEQTEENV
ncbi:AAA family ATPase [Pedobacter immunditicola]|uniref:AAA family ATPase n=1 Tax=Pedobacter immunditicola TaxID=3133440 RepID=UPI0030AF330C